MSFHILKPLHNNPIINITSYISFNVLNQAIIHPLIPHSIAQLIFLFNKSTQLSSLLIVLRRIFAVFLD